MCTRAHPVSHRYRPCRANTSVTTQYHYPLAPLNYCLQLSSIITVLLGVGVRIGVILRHSSTNADQWPYDLDYVAVPVPSPAWNVGEDAAWYLLQAISNGLANVGGLSCTNSNPSQLTHIQFLTLLYPSRTEARLIYFILGKLTAIPNSLAHAPGPLAIASSALFFCALSSSQVVIDLGDAIRNVFSSCLLLIFTISLCIWGFLVNRRRAWRLDGGTGVFGMGALGLAFVTTAVSFVAVKEEGIDWLQHLIWAAVLWQTWLGWWWWVGAGMGIGEVEDLMERAIRKGRRAARHAHRQDVIGGAGTANTAAGRRAQTMAGMVKTASNSAVVGITTGFASILPSHSGSGGSGGDNLHRRATARVVSPRDRDERGMDVEEGIREDIELGSLRLREPHGPRTVATEEGSAGRQQPPSSNSETSSTSRTPSLHPPRTAGELIIFPAIWLQVYFRRLRRAHEDAAHKSAVEQAERRKRVPNMAGTVIPEEGWGLGAYGVREHAESARRVAEADRQIRANHLLGNAADPGTGDEADVDGDGDGDGDGDPLSDPMTNVLEDDDDDKDRVADGREGTSGTTVVEEREVHRHDSSPRPRSARARSIQLSRRTTPAQSVRGSVDRVREGDESRTRRRRDGEGGAGENESEWVDIEENEDAAGPSGRGGAAAAADPARRGQGTGWSWWGPLKDMRLQDRSRF